MDRTGGGEGIMQGWLEPRLKESSEREGGRDATSGGRGFKTAQVNGTCYARPPAHGWIPLAGFAARPPAPGARTSPSLSLGKSASKVAGTERSSEGGRGQPPHMPSTGWGRDAALVHPHSGLGLPKQTNKDDQERGKSVKY